MANKQLTAKVRLNTTQAERSIDNMVRKINQMNNALNRTGNNQVEQQLRRSNTQVNSIANRVRTWATNQRQVLSNTKSTNSALSSIGSRLKGIAATYLGIMGAKTLANTSDTITSAQNKLNYVNASQLGSAGHTADGKDYSNATINATTESMNKMYNSAQKVRMGYDDMMNNVSKSMVLAGDSFDGSIDNAIRFQEIMAEAYSVGGASAQEMSSSMYQLIQALGAGTLAGDELRSVREGASLAYDKIEDFVQGVYNSEESLKDLASQGKVTADMVVAAVMNMGDEMDKAFAMTKQTFAQTWTQIKNAAMKAFEPVSNKLRDMLNKAIDNGLIEKVEKIFVGVANVLLWILDVIDSAINWIAQNWSWLQYVVLGVILVIIGHIIIWTLTTIANAIVRIAMYIMEYWWLLLLVAAVVMLIWIFIQWKNAGIDTCTALTWAIFVVAAAIAIIGLMSGSVFLFVVGLVLALAALIFLKISEIMGWIYKLKAGISNMCQYIGLLWDATWACFPIIVDNAITRVMAFLNGLGAAVSAFGSAVADTMTWIGDWIKYAFGNALEWVADKFNSFIGSVNGSLGWLGVNIPEWVVTNDATQPGSLGEIWSNIGSAYTTTRDAYLASNLKDTGATWDSIMGQYNPIDLDAAYQEGYNLGQKWKQNINDWGAQFQTGGGEFGILDLIGSLFGSNKKGTEDPFGGAMIAPGKMEELLAGLPTPPEDGGTAALKPYNPPSNDELLSGVDGIGKDTGSIAGSVDDAMDLSEEELDVLRKLAERDVINRFTTAEIRVDMTNNNNINSEMDLDGIVTHLSNKLYDELGVVASGVHY